MKEVEGQCWVLIPKPLPQLNYLFSRSLTQHRFDFRRIIKNKKVRNKLMFQPFNALCGYEATQIKNLYYHHYTGKEKDFIELLLYLKENEKFKIKLRNGSLFTCEIFATRFV